MTEDAKAIFELVLTQAFRRYSAEGVYCLGGVEPKLNKIRRTVSGFQV